VMCNQCGKPSWAGCGAHVESVLGDVPKNERCRCDEQPATKSERKGFIATMMGR